ncbi:MAG: hypothetical protein O3A55_04045 [Bacteroidetes bacterium]|nr:hypothetical protein [Bacteroidota bacterium]
MKKYFLFLLLLSSSQNLFPQYNNNEVLQRSFEQVDYFFVPERLNAFAEAIQFNWWIEIILKP